MKGRPVGVWADTCSQQLQQTPKSKPSLGSFRHRVVPFEPMNHGIKSKIGANCTQREQSGNCLSANYLHNVWVVLGLCLLLSGCGGGTTYPRPKGYSRIDLPAHTYKAYKHPGCPFTFEYPAYAEVLQSSRQDSCSVDLYFPAFDAYWHITDRNYRRDKTNRSKSFEDYRQVVYHHAQKAYNIQETPQRWPAGEGMLFEITGEVPTSAQFYLADSNGTGAVMTAFYFKTAVKNDSLAPVIAFLKADMLHMAQTLRFE